MGTQVVNTEGTLQAKWTSKVQVSVFFFVVLTTQQTLQSICRYRERQVNEGVYVFVYMYIYIYVYILIYIDTHICTQ